MPGTLPHTQNGFVQTAADQQLHDKRDPPASEDSDPTTLKFDGNVAISEDEGMDARGRTTQGAVAEMQHVRSAVSAAQAQQQSERNR